MSPLEIPARIPPHNLDAERAVLGAMLLEGREAVPKVIEILRPSDFYTEAHRAGYDTMLRLFDRGEPVDLITLSEELRRTDQLEFVGGPAALALLVEQASIAAHLMSYASIVRDMAVLRELIQTSTQIITQAFDAKEEVQTVVDDAERRIFSLAERRLEGSALPVGRILKDTFEHIERLYERKEHVTGVATGFEKLDLETSGFQPSDFIIIAARPSMGKAQPLDAKVLTPTGWTRMGELRVGDALASIDGAPSEVRGIFPQGRRQAFRVVFSDGRSTECTGDHLWRVHCRSWRAPRTLTTDDIARLLRKRLYQGRVEIDTPVGDFGRDTALPIDPWVLGVLLAGGGTAGTHVRVATADPEILARVQERLPDDMTLRARGRDGWEIVRASAAHRCGIPGAERHPFVAALRTLLLWGLSADSTFVPDLYLDANRQARLDLLKGMLDVGGDVDRRGVVRLCTPSRPLAHGVAMLVRSLGGWCSVRAWCGRAPESIQAGQHRTYACTIAYPEPKALFSVSAKMHRALTAPRRPIRPAFVSIEAVGVVETQCLAVSHPSKLYVTDDYVVTHNTAFALNIAQYVGVHLRQKVLVLSLEMSAQQLVQRMLCSEAKVDSQAVRTGYLTSADWHRLTAAAGRLAEAQIFIDDSAGLTVLEARAKARRLKAEHGLDLIIIDYLQLMRGRANQENRQQEISEISRSLKALAKELNVPVVALSQLSRAVEARAQRDFRPQLSDLRECVTGDTLVVLADGRRVPIQDLVDTAPEVLGMSPDARIVEAKSERIWKVGTRPVRSVRLASGRTLRATERHQFFTGGGWKRLSDIAIGDRVAIARSLPEPRFPDIWPDLRVALLGHLIGDGSYLRGQPMRYATSSEDNSALVTAAAGHEFDSSVKRYAGRRTWHQLLISGNGTRWKPAGVNAWLRALGVFGQRSFQKRVPEAAFRLGNGQIALLLRHLWATDGSIVVRTKGRGAHRVYYSTTSRRLAEDIAALLLRLGIVARLRKSQKRGYRPSFSVDVSGGSDQRRFLARVGAFGPRVAQAERVLKALDNVRVNTNVDTGPPEDFVAVKAAMRRRGISQRRMAALRGTAYGGTSHFKFAPSRDMLSEYAELLDDETLRARVRAEVFWDRVVSIEDGGHEDVFDITVPGPASWLADGIVSHNSGALEQDADLILFIYRQKVYKEDVPPDEEKIAEIIIGKQRNGPIGTVKLIFLPEYARFENAADSHRQPQPF
ncbi:MAG: replicative DNA helicase [Candidatus Rokubacteria bacterium]|nr:replicative DNA helicase [Candidatus Rokubacteria bacterium]